MLNGIDGHQTKSFLTPPLCRLLCNALIQPLFNYAYIAWFSNLSRRLKLHLQVSQNKCISFCLQLDKRSKICMKEILQLNWLIINDIYLQFSVSNIFKFQNELFNELFCLFHTSPFDACYGTHTCQHMHH